VLRYQRLSQEQIVHLSRDVERARRLFAEGGEHNLESEALDALGSLQGYGLGDHGAAFAVAQERLVNVERLELMERIDAWSVAAWELVMIGRYAEAVRAFDDARRQLRAGQSETFLVHVASWSAYAAALCGEWTTTLRLVDALLAMREESGAVVARFTALGWVAGMRVAAAMLDETRLARYRTTFLAIMDTAALRPDDPPRLFVSALLDGDAEAAHQFLAAHSTEERKAEVIAALVFDHDAPVSEGSLEALERSPTPLPDLLSLRIQLARALNSGTDALRQAVEALAAGGLIADAARAATLLALRTRSAQDRADAESRLVALGDRLYLQRLAES
jgi:hypothetical protein